MEHLLSLINGNLYLEGEGELDTDVLRQMQLDRYRIKDELGSGASAQAFLLEHKMLETEAVIRIALSDVNDEEQHNKFLNEARKNTRDIDSLISVYDYSESFCSKYKLQAAYMSLANGMLLEEWLKWRNTLLNQNANDLERDRDDIIWLLEDTFAVGFSYIAELCKMSSIKFIHGDPHPANVFVQIKDNSWKRTDRRWAQFEIPSPLGDTEYLVFEANHCTVKFIDAGTSEITLADDYDIQSISVNRELSKIRETLLALLRPICPHIKLDKNIIKKVFLAISQERQNALTERICLKNDLATFLVLYEIGTITALKALYVAFMNNLDTKPQYTSIEDIIELNTLLDYAILISDAVDLEYLLNTVLSGMIIDDRNRAYRLEGRILKIS